MSNHFTSFTPEAMRAFGQALADSAHARAATHASMRGQVASLMERLRREARDAEQGRRQRAVRDADARRIFASELRAGVHALMGRFELSRKEMAQDIQDMAGEYRAARQAFRSRAARPSASRREQPQPQPQPQRAAPPAPQSAQAPQPGKPEVPAAQASSSAEAQGSLPTKW